MRRAITVGILLTAGLAIAAGSGPLLLFQNGGSALGAAPTLNAGSGLSMSITNGVATMSVTGGGSGTVTSVSATVPADLSVSVTNPTTTPAIAITRNNIYRVTGSDFTTTSASASTITGLSWSVTSGSAYFVECALAVVSGGSAGVQVGLVASAAVTTLQATATKATTTNTPLVQQLTSSGVLTSSCTSACTLNTPTTLTGVFVAGADGTLSVVAASSTAGQTATVKVGSSCIVW